MALWESPWKYPDLGIITVNPIDPQFKILLANS